jgi:cold shock CspA family protein
VFVHFSGIQVEGSKGLLEGDKVEYQVLQVLQGSEGPQAQQVHRR